ncbi:MAG TPA: septum formation protein Maf, partial [Acidimicrobiaceae bacterium]|nr:septum formation protein Maf [Acidimicrobiaceae bacterium]
LLRRIGVEPVVRPADIDETPHAGETPAETVSRLARTKARTVERTPGELVIAADTEVVLRDGVLGKPADASGAAAMLRSLSGRSHRVVTGVHLVCGDEEAAAVEETVVHVRELTEAEIDAYVATGEPFGKAGAYAIQGAGGMLVERIEGSDTNVIGLPLTTVVRLAGEVGVTLLPR